MKCPICLGDDWSIAPRDTEAFVRTVCPICQGTGELNRETGLPEKPKRRVRDVTNDTRRRSLKICP